MLMPGQEEEEETASASIVLPRLEEHIQDRFRHLRDAAIIYAKTAEQVIRIGEVIHRQMSALPVEARRLRTAATDFNVAAALSNIPRIRSALFKIANSHELLAAQAEHRYVAYLRTRV
jgi:hypothetical protein